MEGMSPFVANLYVQLNSPVANLRDVVKVLLENDLIMNITTTVKNADGLGDKGMIYLAPHTLLARTETFQSADNLRMCSRQCAKCYALSMD